MSNDMGNDIQTHGNPDSTLIVLKTFITMRKHILLKRVIGTASFKALSEVHAKEIDGSLLQHFFDIRISENYTLHPSPNTALYKHFVKPFETPKGKPNKSNKNAFEILLFGVIALRKALVPECSGTWFAGLDSPMYAKIDATLKQL